MFASFSFSITKIGLFEMLYKPFAIIFSEKFNFVSKSQFFT